MEYTCLKVAVDYFKIPSQHFPEWTEEHRNLKKKSRISGFDLNLGPLEYETEVLTMQPRHSVQVPIPSTVWCLGTGTL
jgi:hypothetical protein